MATLLTRTIAPSSDDKRWPVVDATMRRHGYAPSALIEALHDAQQSFGYPDEPARRYVAAGLGAPLSLVFGVATFYHYVGLKSEGEHVLVHARQVLDRISADEAEQFLAFHASLEAAS